MKACVINNGIVENIIEVDALDFLPGLVAWEADVSVGDSYDGSIFTPRVPTQEELDESAAREALATEEAVNPLTGITVAQAEQYIEDNVIDLASAKEALKKLAKQVIILRSK